MSKIKASFWFRSESNPKKVYESLEYADGCITCNCPGWTRRCKDGNIRDCKHVRMVRAGIAGQHAERVMKWGVEIKTTVERVTETTTTRKFTFTDNDD